VHESAVGQGTCSSCHSGDSTPVGEDINPSYYGLGGVTMKDACDADGSESAFGATGLDNDGDGQRDASDPDCQLNSAPGQPGMLSASDVTTSSATVQWGASGDGNGDSVTYQVEYRRNGDTPWNDGGSTTGTSQPLSGLDAGTPYDVQVTPNDGTLDGPARTVLNLFQTEAGDLPFLINDALSDAWYFPDTDGQGFFVIVYPEKQSMFLSWFTFDTVRPDDSVVAVLGDPGHRWLTAQGTYSGNQAVLNVSITSGGVFDSGSPAPVRDQDGVEQARAAGL
jgi:hypothetical protein